jgi:ribosome assembly protein YihI (activator of Der GTPase)
MTAMVLHVVLVIVTVTALIVAFMLARQFRHLADGETRRIASETAKHVDEQLEAIHMLVNSRLDEALERIELLEHKLGLEPGESPDAERPARQGQSEKG